jgi:cytochrome bd-type quinol oxidase subunit 2
MDTSAIDFPAFALATLVALGITLALGYSSRGDSRRRSWMVAGVISAVLVAIGLVDLLRATPRETHVATVLLGAPLPVLGSLGMILATRRVRGRFRWPIVFVTAFILLFGGLLLGAAVLPKYLPS